MKVWKYLTVLSLLVLVGCQESKPTLFEKIDPSYSGLNFSNDLSFDKDFNIFRYRNYYNGGGVALADVNGDGLLDIYLVANLTSNKLYLNRGDLKFEDVTEEAGVGGTRAWSTGVSVADVNGDGLLDIYVCNSGDIEGDNKQNELFINNGDGSFSEEAEKYGLDDRGFSTHAAFFDYDKDGDIDMYLLNNSYQAIGSFNLRKNERPIRDKIGGDKLYRNEGNKFVDVSEEAGIYGSVIGFGLGVTVGDVDKDGWLDIYVSNDFFERDYLYINNKKGGFDEVLEDRIKAVSAASMGADMGDLNNDGLPEIFVTDMLPATNERLKTVTTFDSWDRYQYSLENGYWHQFTRNTLQFNNGDNTFSEIGRYSGVEASDWSWGALMFDFENDGNRDLFIANGIYQDLTNQDFLQFVTQSAVTERVTAGGEVDYELLISYIPSVPVPNHAYVNQGDLVFENRAAELGLGEETFSSGSAYGDLDNDGDLDLVVNNTNMTTFLFENHASESTHESNYLKFILKGENGNTQALGTNITVYSDSRKFYVEHLPTRGFQSTVDHRPHIGLGDLSEVDSVVVQWPSLKRTRLYSVKTNQTLELNESDGINEKSTFDYESSPVYKTIEAMPFKHKENPFVDFDRDRLLFQMLSTQGPCLCKADINGDGLEDIYVGGAADQPGQIALQTDDGFFGVIAQERIARDSLSEDVACEFFDANGDGLMDLYVVSGGSDFEPADPRLADRLYLMQEDGTYDKVRGVFPANRYESTSVVDAADYDGDGDMDLFAGGRLQTYQYGYPRSGYILQNDGNGNFTNVSDEIAPDLNEIGMISDGSWIDIDGDDDLDIVIVGEWMPVTIMVNENGRFSSTTLPNSSGWWNSVTHEDFNGDGLPELVLGNHGLNSRFKASTQFPLKMYVKDFDRNGTIEQLICQYEGENLFPLSLRHDLAMQMPGVKKKYLKYESYKDQEITDVFSEENLKDALELDSKNLETMILQNMGNLSFSPVKLPKEVQFSCVYDAHILDYNDDGHLDVLMGGNLYGSKPEMGRYDASYGVLLQGDGNLKFEYVEPAKSGLKLDREVRAIETVKRADDTLIMVANSDDQVQTFAKNQ